MKIGHLDSTKPMLSDVRPGKTPQVENKHDAKDRKVSSGAEIEISDHSRLMKTALDMAKGAPDVRELKVMNIKNQIKDGSYQIDAERLAEKIIADHLAHDFGKNNL